MFLMYSQETPGGPPPEEIERLKTDHGSVSQEATEKGKAVTIDGPFAETKEPMAGFYILECLDLDEAMERAKRMPTSCKGAPGCIEIQPIAALPPVPDGGAP